MEAAIIKDLFLQVERKGARVTKYIADADANTFKLLQTLSFGKYI
jgi:hypothetical protein